MTRPDLREGARVQVAFESGVRLEGAIVECVERPDGIRIAWDDGGIALLLLAPSGSICSSLSGRDVRVEVLEPASDPRWTRREQPIASGRFKSWTQMTHLFGWRGFVKGASGCGWYDVLEENLERQICDEQNTEIADDVGRSFYENWPGISVFRRTVAPETSSSAPETSSSAPETSSSAPERATEDYSCGICGVRLDSRGVVCDRVVECHARADQRERDARDRHLLRAARDLGLSYEEARTRYRDGDRSVIEARSRAKVASFYDGLSGLGFAERTMGAPWWTRIESSLASNLHDATRTWFTEPISIKMGPASPDEYAALCERSFSVGVDMADAIEQLTPTKMDPETVRRLLAEPDRTADAWRYSMFGVSPTEYSRAVSLLRDEATVEVPSLRASCCSIDCGRKNAEPAEHLPGCPVAPIAGLHGGMRATPVSAIPCGRGWLLRAGRFEIKIHGGEPPLGRVKTGARDAILLDFYLPPDAAEPDRRLPVESDPDLESVADSASRWPSEWRSR